MTRSLAISVAILAAVTLVSRTAPARAAQAAPSPSEPYCSPAADKSNHPPAATLKSVPAIIGANTGSAVTVTATATDPDKDKLSYDFTYSGGRMTGEGATRVWDLGGVSNGTYTAKLLIDDGRGCTAYLTIDVPVER